MNVFSVYLAVCNLFERSSGSFEDEFYSIIFSVMGLCQHYSRSISASSTKGPRETHKWVTFGVLHFIAVNTRHITSGAVATAAELHRYASSYVNIPPSNCAIYRPYWQTRPDVNCQDVPASLEPTMLLDSLAN